MATYTDKVIFLLLIFIIVIVIFFIKPARIPDYIEAPSKTNSSNASPLSDTASNTQSSKESSKETSKETSKESSKESSPQANGLKSSIGKDFIEHFQLGGSYKIKTY
jgi:cytoskeletal protein RodZ